MAEFLIYAKNNTHKDPIKDSRGCYKRGDIVVVMPDGHEWGKEEGLPTFFVLKIPGVDAEKAKMYISSHLDNEVIVRRLKYSLDLTSIPNVLKNEIQSTGEYTATWNQVRSYILNKQSATSEILTDTAALS
jgi:hypothetical protein